MAILQPVIPNYVPDLPQPDNGNLLNLPEVVNTTFYSSKLLNHIESERIKGVLKSVFYTEVNTNVNIGDRVFIINGNYDSDNFISKNKYRKYSDGYRVLGVDGCRVVLDLDFTGQLPYKSYTTKNFINIHHIETQKDFDYINSIKIPSGVDNKFISIFGGNILDGGIVSLLTQNIVFTSNSYSGSTDIDNSNTGLNLSGDSGFFIRFDNSGINDWIEITPQFVAGLIKQNDKLNGSNRIFIIGENFTYDGQEFVERGVYKYENYQWVFDTEYYQPYLSKVNFRSGKFRGTHNDGVFGTYLKRNKWRDSKWNSGVFINSVWENGSMNSKHTTDEKSYSAILRLVGSISNVLQSEDVSNNRGFGYNFIEDSTFNLFTIENGNFKNCNFFNSSDNKDPYEIFYKSNTPFVNVINGGRFEMCDLTNFRSAGGYFLNSSIANSNIRKSKFVSSEVVNSTIDQGAWSTEGGIVIKGAEMCSFDYNEGNILGSTYSKIEGTLKLYISEDDYFKLKKGDAFYIRKINKNIIIDSLTENQRIHFPIENRFLIDNYSDYTLLPNVKKEIHVSLKSSFENSQKFFVGPSINPIPTYNEVIDGDNLDFWYKLPPTSTNPNVPSLRGEYDGDYDLSPGYHLGDFIYEFDTNISGLINFYQYNPINRQSSDRSKTQDEAIAFRNIGQGTQLINGFSDWLFVGTYSGVWATSGVYEGFYIDEQIIPFAPKYPFGSVIGTDIDVLVSSNFWIFVGGLDGVFTNKSKLNLIKVDYISQNFMTSSNFDLPSIDIKSDMFGWYKDNNNITKFSSSYNFLPLNPDNVNGVFVNTVLGNGDLKSGLFNNSEWTSGDMSNLPQNEFIPIDFQPNRGVSVPNNYDIKLDLLNGRYVMKFSRSTKLLSSIYSYEGYDYTLNDRIWIQSLDYTVGNTKVTVDGRYKIAKITKNEITLDSDELVNPLDSLPLGGKFSTPNFKSNKYFSFHKVAFKNSKITSGKFYRTSFENCRFQNDSFKKYLYPLQDINNSQIIRIINVLFDRTKNTINSGLVYKSHFVNETFNGGTFYESFWKSGIFSDGLFKNSVWIDGSFNNGKFVDNKSPLLTNFDFDYSRDYTIWQNGNFNNGEFFNSLWVRGTFNNGRFYKSDWTGGIWNNGILGSKNLRSQETTLSYYGPSMSFGATFTYWYDGIVENAILGGDGALDWFGGKILSGVFTSNGRTDQKHSIWHNGEFFGSTFEKQAWWKNGKFYSGKFRSEIGWDLVSFTTYSNDINNYGWVNGEFYSGEFGFGTPTGINSMWYDGVFYNGTFQGKFWRNGILLDGNFYGNFQNNGEISENLYNYNTSFYGMWNDGNVTSVLYNIKNDEVVKNNTPTNRRRRQVVRIPSPNLSNIIWKNGTFSHQNGNINDSVWFNGNFSAGNFNNSIFNPFVDMSLSGFSYADYRKKIYLTNLFNTLVDSISSSTQLSPINSIPSLNTIVEEYNNNSRYNLDLIVDFTSISGVSIVDTNSLSTQDPGWTVIENIATSQIDITIIMRVKDTSLYNKDNDEFFVVIYYVDSSQQVTTQTFYKNPITLQNIPMKYEERDTCVWTGGNFNGGEFNYSKWFDGNFSDGTMSGAIWLDGKFDYGFMYNCHWENGVWRNGNWFGANFDYKSLFYDGTEFIIDDKKTLDIVKNIYNYDIDNPDMFLSDVIVLTDSLLSDHTFNPSLGFVSWTYSTDE